MKPLRLTEDDYILVFPFATPIEIRTEFGEHSHCIASIRNRYRRLRYSTQKKALDLWKAEAQKLKPSGVTNGEWDRKIKQDIEQRKTAAFKRIHARLEDRIALHTDHQNRSQRGRGNVS
jgi:hypothetical protein